MVDSYLNDRTLIVETIVDYSELLEDPLPEEVHLTEFEHHVVAIR